MERRHARGGARGLPAVSRGSFTIPASLCLALWANPGAGGAALAQELAAHPTEPVISTELMDAVDELRLESIDGSEAGSQEQDSLYALITSASTLSVAEAEALLNEAYDAYPTPTTRARAFGAAATAASSSGRHELALAWMDWAVTEAGQSPERELLLADLLAEGVGVALAADNPVVARAYVRQGAAHASGGRDDAAGRAVAFDRVKLVCPDVIADAYLRTRAAAMQNEPGLMSTPSAECAYVPIEGGADAGFRIYAVRSFIDLEERTREVAELGLGGPEVDERARLVRRLSSVTTVVDPLFIDGDPSGLLAYARHDRVGVDDVAAFAYATAARDGVFYAAAAAARDWAWPPEELGRRVEAGLLGVLAAEPSADR